MAELVKGLVHELIKAVQTKEDMEVVPERSEFLHKLNEIKIIRHDERRSCSFRGRPVLQDNRDAGAEPFV